MGRIPQEEAPLGLVIGNRYVFLVWCCGGKFILGGIDTNLDAPQWAYLPVLWLYLSR